MDSLVMQSTPLELFLPNNLSQANIQLRQPDFAAERYVREVLRTGFGISVVETVHLILNSGVLSANYLVKTTQALLVVKARPGVGNVTARLEYETDLSFKLMAAGLPVPEAFISRNGKTVVTAFNYSWSCFYYCAGSYFQGSFNELRSAARGFAVLSIFLGRQTIQPDALVYGGHHLAALEELLLSTPVPPPDDPSMATLYAQYRDDLLRTIDYVVSVSTSIDERRQLMHTDFHPLNLLMDSGCLTAILDFEDIKPYSVSAACGFAAYKLIRQSLVIEPSSSRHLVARNLVDCWHTEWSRHHVDVPLSKRSLGEGALYRVLDLLHTMLDAWLRKRDTKYNFDFQKQIISIYEINYIFQLQIQFANT
jgi:hypothetical protein